jgi:uncharacterized membrane protein YjjB (DUF3815 family)
MEWLMILEKGIWFGTAAIGFGILFNVPSRTIFLIWVLAAIGGITKLILVKMGASVILASFAGATLIGILSIPFAHNRHTPPLVLSIPALIPMVPGVFAYRTMIGLIKLTGDIHAADYSTILQDTVNNGIKTLMILAVLATGASIPMLVTRRTSAKEMKFKKKEHTQEDSTAEDV